MDVDERVEHQQRMKRTRIVQMGYFTGVFGVLAAARDMVEFKDFSWDAMMLEANAEERTTG